MRPGIRLPAVLLAILACAAGIARADDALPVGGTHVGSTLFLDASHIDESVGGVHDAARSGDGVDLKRLYLMFDHRFSSVWSVHLLTDINWQRHQDPTDLWLKHAYLQGAFSRAFVLRVGSAATPWIGLTNQWYGYRYVESDLLSRAKVGTTADWGIHALGTLGGGGAVSYAVAAITGAGFKQPRLGNGPDLVARVAWQPIEHLVLALGGYRGTLAQDVAGRAAQHVARRHDALLAWADSRWRLGGQYFHTSDWTHVTSPLGDRSHGWSAWASAQLAPRVALFARHDRFASHTDFGAALDNRYTNAGVEWRAQKWLRLAAVYKHERLARTAAPTAVGDEIGVWSQWSF